MQDFSNNAASILTTGINNSVTSIILADAGSFPTPAGGRYFLATLIGLNTNGQENVWEIVKCTTKVGNTLTVVRAQDNTAAAAWGVGTRLELRETAGFANLLDAHVDNVSNPHAVTKAQVGLGSVNNTADSDKPVSTAQAAADGAVWAAAAVYADSKIIALNDSPIRLNPRKITANFAIASNYNAASVGPITIAEGVTVTVGDNATWSVH